MTGDLRRLTDALEMEQWILVKHDDEAAALRQQTPTYLDLLHDGESRLLDHQGDSYGVTIRRADFRRRNDHQPTNLALQLQHRQPLLVAIHLHEDHDFAALYDIEKIVLQQIEQRRYVLLYGNSTNTTWKTTPIRRLMKRDDCHITTGHACQLGVENIRGQLVYQPYRVVTNDSRLLLASLFKNHEAPYLDYFWALTLDHPWLHCARHY